MIAFTLLATFLAPQAELALPLARLHQSDFKLLGKTGCSGGFRQDENLFVITSTDRLMLRTGGRRIVLKLTPKLGQEGTDPRDEVIGGVRIHAMPHLTEGRAMGRPGGPVYRVVFEQRAPYITNFAGQRETPVRVSISNGTRSTHMDGIWSFYCQ